MDYRQMDEQILMAKHLNLFEDVCLFVCFMYFTKQKVFALQPGPWTYTLNNTHHSPQALKMTVASRASTSAVSPAIVEAFVDRDDTHFPDPVMIYAIVRKGFYPILNATVIATVEPETGEPVTLKLLDNGAGE